MGLDEHGDKRVYAYSGTQPYVISQPVRQVDVYQTAFGPLQEVYRKQVDLQLKKVQQQADAQRRLAEAAYSQSRSNLQRQETGSWNALTKSAMSRGLGASPLASYEQRKVAETYAPEYQQLETNRAANLSNIASQAALASETLAAQGMQLEAQYYSQLAQAALDALNRESDQQRQYAQRMAEYFAGLGDKQSEEKWRQAQFALQEAGVTGTYRGQPTLARQELDQQRAYQNAQLELDRLRAASGGQESGIPPTAGERMRNAGVTPTKRARKAVYHPPQGKGRRWQHRRCFRRERKGMMSCARPVTSTRFIMPFLLCCVIPSY